MFIFDLGNFIYIFAPKNVTRKHNHCFTYNHFWYFTYPKYLDRPKQTGPDQASDQDLNCLPKSSVFGRLNREHIGLAQIVGRVVIESRYRNIEYR